MSAEREKLRERIAAELYAMLRIAAHWPQLSQSDRRIWLQDADRILALLDAGERPEPVLYARRKVLEAVYEALREGDSGTIMDHLQFNPDAEDIAVYDLVPLYAEPVGRAQESEREHLTERAFDLADGLSDALWGGERGWEGRSAEQTLRVLRERLRASEPAEAETEVIDGVRGLFIHADAVPDVVMVNGVHFTPTESREGEERDASTCGASVFDYHGEAGECVLRDGHDGDCYAGPHTPGGTE